MNLFRRRHILLSTIRVKNTSTFTLHYNENVFSKYTFFQLMQPKNLSIIKKNENIGNLLIQTKILNNFYL